MRIRLATIEDADAWLAMRAALWPEAGVEDLRPEVAAFFGGRMEPAMLHRVFVAEANNGALVLELSLRPYADGCHGSPVPYLEGWYVEPEARRQGVGGALVKAA